MSDQHSYGLHEWQTEQLRGMPVERLTAEHAATTDDEYRAKVESEFMRRRLVVPDAPAPKPKRRKSK